LDAVPEPRPECRMIFRRVCLAEVPMSATLPLLAVLLAAPPVSDRDTERRVAELARQVVGEGGEREFVCAAAAAEELGKMGPRALPAVPALLRALRISYVGPRAAHALIQIDPGNKEAIPELVKDLGSRDPYLRRNACVVLAAFGEKARH